MGRQAQTEGFLPRRMTPPSVAKATATSPFAAFAENGEGLKGQKIADRRAQVRLGHAAHVGSWDHRQLRVWQRGDQLVG